MQRSRLRALLVGMSLACASLACEEPPPRKEPSAEAKPLAPPPAAASPASVPTAAQIGSSAAVDKPADKPEAKLISCPKPPQVAFNDPVLEAEIRRKASKPEGDLTIADLRKVRSVDLTRAGKPTDMLDPCVFPHLTSLRHLYLAGGELSDLSPIAGLKQLEGLRASMNQVANITPLAAMVKMDRLDLGRTQVRDLSPLKGMTKLTELMLDDTPVDDLSPLASLASLERLSIKRTRVSDVSPLKGLRKLKFLYVGGSPVESVSAIARPGLKISSED